MPVTSGFKTSATSQSSEMTSTGKEITAHIADITKLEVDAVVNAANNGLLAGGGVCGAIFRAAGAGLSEACQRLAPCPTGQARITPGFALPAKFIIHAVGPIWHGGNEGEPELLAGAYRSALKLADEQACRSIAFPAISTGIFGYPLQAATDIAVKEVQEHLAGRTGIEQVVFACFSDDVLRAYRSAGVT
jgi:O-acetyl-ADP-ribose deacetylase (regulator of RNase III)